MACITIVSHTEAERTNAGTQESERARHTQKETAKESRTGHNTTLAWHDGRQSICGKQQVDDATRRSRIVSGEHGSIESTAGGAVGAAQEMMITMTAATRSNHRRICEKNAHTQAHTDA